MDNRYEIAEQNDMSREFADWFFDNKKAGCGNVWFVMMAAMWEGWQGRAAQPATVVPEEKPMPKASNMFAIDAVAAIAEARGWNACRAALLQGSQPVSKREQVRREHAEWSDKTFGNVGPVGPLKHLSKEALEAAAEPDDLSEWADMQFLLWDAQRRAGISDGEITAAMEEKLAVNMARQWPEPKDGEPRLHIKTDQRQEHM